MGKIPSRIELKSERIILRKLLVSDVTQRYVDWLNDPEVSRFLSIRGSVQSIDTVREFVVSYENAADRLLLGIFDAKNGSHIGNITFSSIEWKNDAAMIGISVGDMSYWGKGYATEAIQLAVRFAFQDLKLHRLEAGVSNKNTSSRKLFEKAGFVREGQLRDREKFIDGYADAYIYGLLNE